MEEGFKYLITIEGALRLLVLVFSCITFALLAASSIYLTPPLEWVLAAFIISFSISFLFFFFRAIGFSSRMQCRGPITYSGFDFLWSWFSTSWCLAAALTFTLNFPSNYSDGEAIGSVIFAYCTFILYAIETYTLRLYAPANIGFVATKHGWVKTALVVFGASTFGLMVDSGYNWCWPNTGCHSGLTFALVAFTVTWSVTALMWIAHLVGTIGSFNAEENEYFKKGELVWAVVGVLLFWTGASCFAAYMHCEGNEFEWFPYCRKRLSGVITGFVTGLIYLIEIFILR